MADTPAPDPWRDRLERTKDRRAREQDAILSETTPAPLDLTANIRRGPGGTVSIRVPTDIAAKHGGYVNLAGWVFSDRVHAMLNDKGGVAPDAVSMDTPAPSALDALLKEVESINATATSAPWTVGDDHRVRGVAEEGPHADHVVPGLEAATRVRVIATLHGPGNGDAIAHYRTAAPRLAAIVRVLLDITRRTNDGLRKVVDCPFCGCRCGCGNERCPTAVLPIALSRAEAIARGEE